MIPWGWSDERRNRSGHGGLVWLQPFAAAAPWITVAVLALMMHMVSMTFTSEKGLLFELPSGDGRDGVTTQLVALVLAMPQDTLVFFDDARYSLNDESAIEAFALQLSERSAKLGENALLVLADGRVPGGALIKLGELARRAGLSRVLFAEKRSSEAVE